MGTTFKDLLSTVALFTSFSNVCSLPKQPQPQSHAPQRLDEEKTFRGSSPWKAAPPRQQPRLPGPNAVLLLLPTSPPFFALEYSQHSFASRRSPPFRPEARGRAESLA